MCFSATASFIAAGTLAVIGVCAFAVAKSKSFYLLAAMPLLFAIQQGVEGIVWLTHSNPGYQYCHYLSTHLFLFFAFMIWPIWIPLAVCIAEKIKRNQQFLMVCVAIGILLTIYNIYKINDYQHFMTVISDHIYYGMGFPMNFSPIIYLLIYMFATVFPLFISSLRWTKTTGVISLTSVILTYIFMMNAFISVWCFFSAVISCFVLIIIKSNNHKGISRI